MQGKLRFGTLAATLLILALSCTTAYHQSDVYASRILSYSMLRAATAGGDSFEINTGETCVKQEEYFLFYSGYFICRIPSKLDCREYEIYMEYSNFYYRFRPDTLERQIVMVCGSAFPGLSKLYPIRRGG